MTKERYSMSDDYLSLIYVLDGEFHAKMLIDTYISFVWTERYGQCGDFELVIPIDAKVVQVIDLDNYLAIRESDQLMIIETMTANTDEEGAGDTITLSGRTLDAYLDRRIVWYDVKGKMTFAALIKRLLDENAVKPQIPERVITGLTYEDPTDPVITGFKEEEYEIGFGEGLYTTLVSLCSEKKVAFRVKHGEDGAMTFQLYRGVDRTWDQTKVPAVIFSASYENLISSDFVQSEINYASNALVTFNLESGTGDDVTSTKKIMEIYRKPERVGLKRREILIDVGDSGIKSPEAALNAAKTEMSMHTVTLAFGSNVDPAGQFVFERDYFIGDIVQVQNRYGFQGRCRIDEVVRSCDASGPVLTPTFVSVDSDNEEVST